MVNNQYNKSDKIEQGKETTPSEPVSSLSTQDSDYEESDLQKGTKFGRSTFSTDLESNFININKKWNYGDDTKKEKAPSPKCGPLLA